MGKYLKLFDTHAKYLAFTQTSDFIKPNVSHCITENEVHYNPWTYADAYLTTVAREDGTISFNIWKSMGIDMITSISYSTDNGETWTTTNNVNDKTEHLVINVNVNEGDKVLWKGDALQMGYNDEDGYGDYVGSFFSSTCEFDVQGNVMSLLYGDDFKNETTLEGDALFAYLFSGYDGNIECKVVNAKNLSLPATTLASNCYQDMFRNCTSLVTTPQLLATTLASGCYNGMFYGCTSLVTAPELPATTLAESCYDSMFNNCTSLINAPELPATTLANSCYNDMFQNCTSLTIAPQLPATTLAERCYYGMFNGCTSLVTTPELPVTTLANNCYSYMFNKCTSLVTPPILPATTLASNCYYGMFNGCTSLTTAPALPATTLAEACYGYMFKGCISLTTAPELLATRLKVYCYNGMFYGCSNLNYIKAMFTTKPSASFTSNWVNGVASSGTFVKNSAATWNVTDTNGIPSGWTVETASE